MEFAANPVPGVGHVFEHEAVSITPSLARQPAAVSGSFTAHLVRKHVGPVGHRLNSGCLHNSARLSNRRNFILVSHRKPNDGQRADRRYPRVWPLKAG